jgi:hypothetical protein
MEIFFSKKMICTSHMNKVVRGTETPKDIDEVKRREG